MTSLYWQDLSAMVEQYIGILEHDLDVPPHGPRAIPVILIAMLSTIDLFVLILKNYTILYYTILYNTLLFFT